MKTAGTAAAIATIGAAMALTPAAQAESAHAHGFHVSGGKQLPGNILHGGSVSLDNHGTEHVVAVRQRPSGDIDLGYYLRPKGTKTWQIHRVHGGEDAHLNDQVVTSFSPSGARLLAVDAHCATDSIRVGETNTRGPRGPFVAEAFTHDEYNCKNYGPVTFVDATALSSQRAILLFGSHSDDGAPTFSIGNSSNKVFSTPTALPNPDALDMNAVAITRDLSTGAVFAVGTVETKGDGGTETAAGVLEWRWEGGTDWSDPESVVSGPWSAVAATADDNRQTILLDPNPGSGRHLNVVNHLSDGSWSGPTRVPHLLSQPGVVMATNVATKSVHVVYADDGGIDQIVRVKGEWHKPRLIVKRQGIAPTTLAVRANGHPIVGYVRY